MTTPDITPEDLKVFLEEAEEQLQLMGEDIVRLESEQTNSDLLQEIFRAAHTLKGSSAMLGYQQMADLAHSAESVLDKIRKGTLPVTTRVVDALLHSLDALNVLKDRLTSSGVGEVDITSTVAELESAMGDEGAHERPEGPLLGPPILSEESRERLKTLLGAGQKAYEVRASLNPQTPFAAVRCFQVIEALSNVGEVLASSPTQEDVEAERVGFDIRVVLVTQQEQDTLRTAAEAVDDVESVEIVAYLYLDPAEDDARPSVEQTTSNTSSASQQQAKKSQTVRIDVERLDHLMNMVGELIIDRTRMVQIGSALKSRYREDDLVEALGKTSDHIVKVVDELQETTMKVRMLPIGTVFSGFPRLVRDLAQRVNKKVNFVLEGQETEIDRTVIDRIRDPLVHLLRNCVDHGIETPSQRKAAAKPEAGLVQLSAYHEQGHIVITVQDDGRGIDTHKVKDSAVKKGLLSAEAASRLSEAEALELIFIPGSSTAEKTTDVSGRGVGMDIVKSNIEAINGLVSVDTTVGEGTNFTLRLPLTLATLRALLVSVNETLYAVPLVYVLETVVRDQSEISTVGGKEIIRLRGNIVPVVWLSAVLGTGSSMPTNLGKVSIVVVRFRERLFGLAVESLAELQEIVVKSLGEYIGNVKGVAGASILGDGQVVLILDVATLIHTELQGATRGG